MNGQRLSRVEELFHGALEVEPAERAAWIARRAEGDARMQADVERLVAARARGEQWFDQPLARLPNDVAKRASAMPLRVGPWRLERLIARGGMGAVHVGVREDRGVVQRAAVKLLDAHLAGPAFERRFALEARLLARLEHEGIARFLDAGVAGSDEAHAGVPWIAMELVEGDPIDVYCEARALSARERVALLIDVCAAVEHAHANLVVHRDLKPSNVLVAPSTGRAGAVKLVDFGIARLVDESALPRADRATTLAFLTPAYASPEEISGDPTTTASDVYSLGAVLFELLAGAPPHDLSGRSPADVERIVRDEVAPRASDVAHARGRIALAREASGDLDLVVGRALAKEAARRYRSAADFARDLASWRDGLPVRARPSTAAYRFAKLVRRHRIATSALLAITLSLCSGGWLAWRGFREARSESARANLAAQDEARAAEAARQAAEDARREGAVAVRTRGVLGDILRAAVGARFAGQSFEPAAWLERSEELLRGLDGDPAAQASVLDAISLAWNEVPDVDRALAAARRAHELAQSSIAPDDPLRAQIAYNLAFALEGAREFEAALEVARGARDARRRDSLDVRERNQHAMLTARIAASLRRLGRLDEARGEIESVLASFSVLADTGEPRGVAYRIVHAERMRIERQAGRASAMLDAQWRVTLSAIDDLGRDSLFTVDEMNHLASVLALAGRAEEAVSWSEAAVEIARRVGDRDRRPLERALRELGNQLVRVGRVDEAEAPLRLALASMTRDGAPEVSELIGLEADLATAARGARKLDDADAWCRSALARATRAGPSVGALLADAWFVLAEIERARGRGRDALDAAHMGLAIRERLQSGVSPYLLRARRLVGEALVAAGEHDAAIAWLTDVVAAARAAKSKNAAGAALLSLGRACEAAERDVEAAAAWSDALELLGGKGPEVPVARIGLGIALLGLDRAAEASSELEQGLDALAAEDPRALERARARAALELARIATNDPLASEAAFEREVASLEARPDVEAPLRARAARWRSIANASPR